MKTDLTIIVPAYGVEKYLRECLESCAAQKGDVGVIVSDDGALDFSGGIADEFAARDTRFIALHAKNGRVARARNRATDIADAEWLWFVDGDDIIAEDSAASLAPLMAEAYDIIYFRYMMHGAPNADDALEARALNADEIAELRRQAIYARPDSPMKRFWMMSSSFSIYNARFIRENGLRAPNIDKGQDTLFNLAALLKCERAATIDKTLYIYRRNENSISVKYNPKIAEDMFKVVDAFKRLVADCDDPEIPNRIKGRVMQMSRISACLNFCNAHNPKKYALRRAEFMRHMNRPDVREAFKGAAKTSESLFNKVIYTLFSLKQFMALNAMYRLYTRGTRRTM